MAFGVGAHKLSKVMHVSKSYAPMIRDLDILSTDKDPSTLIIDPMKMTRAGAKS